jgi:hypothetical protein
MECDDVEGVEAGLGLGFVGEGILIGGVELFPLPKDFKYFRKNVGLVPETGRLPSSLEEPIIAAQSKGELPQLH